MFEEPGDGDDLTGYAAFAGDEVEEFAQVNAMSVVGRMEVDGTGIDQAAAAKRAPGLWTNMLANALVQRSVMKPLELREADLDLIDDEWHGTRLLQGANLARVKVAYAEFAHFAFMLEFGEGAGHLLRIAEIIRPVKQVEVDRLQLHALKGFLAGTDDVAGTEIVAIG